MRDKDSRKANTASKSEVRGLTHPTSRLTVQQTVTQTLGNWQKNRQMWTNWIQKQKLNRPHKVE